MFRELFFFDEMLFPKVMTFIYWIALLFVVGGGITTMFADSFFTGIGIIVGGFILTRIWFELIVVLFKINEALQEIRKK